MKELKKNRTFEKSSDLPSKLTLKSIARVHVTLLQLNGLIPFKEGRLWFLLQVLLCLHTHASHFFITSTFSCHVVRNILKDVNEVGAIAELVGVTGAHLRFLILYFKRAELLAIFGASEKLCSNLNNSERLTVRNFVKRSTNLSLVYIVCALTVCVFYLMISQLQSPRSLPYGLCMEVPSSPGYEFALAAQMISTMTISITCAGIDTAAPFCIMVACGCINSLCHRLEQLASLEYLSENEARNMEKEMVTCIIFHQKIIKFCKKIQNLTSYLFLTQILSTAYNTSLLGLKVVEADVGRVKYILMICLMLCQLVLCQWAPDLLVSQSKYLEQSSYFMPFFGYADGRVSKIIHLLMLRSQKLIRLSAGGFINLSMEFFGNLITSAISFFTVLHSIK